MTKRTTSRHRVAVPSPGPQYILLKEGDIIQIGDEYYLVGSGWTTTSTPGTKYDNRHPYKYRRLKANFFNF